MPASYQQSVVSGLVRLEGGSSAKGSQANRWVVHWNVGGAAVFHHPEGNFLYDSGFLLAKPGAFCSWSVDSKFGGEDIPGFWKILFFFVPATPRMEKAFAHKELRKGFIRFDVAEPALRRKIEKALRRANDFASSGMPQASELALTSVEEAFLWWEHANEDPACMDRRVKMALQYLRANMTERLKISDVVRHCGLSRPRLMSLFRKETGESLMASFERMRMRQASKKLETGMFSVKEIAGIFGYTDARYFSRRFKKIMEFTPKAGRSLASN